MSCFSPCYEFRFMQIYFQTNYLRDRTFENGFLVQIRASDDTHGDGVYPAVAGREKFEEKSVKKELKFDSFTIHHSLF